MYLNPSLYFAVLYLDFVVAARAGYVAFLLLACVVPLVVTVLLVAFEFHFFSTS